MREFYWFWVVLVFSLEVAGGDVSLVFVDKSNRWGYYNGMRADIKQDENLLRIKESIDSVLPGSRILLFGSRSRGDFDGGSDYDILVICNQNLELKERRRYAGKIRKEMAVMGIPVDLLIKTETDYNYYKDKIGSVIRDAVRGGIAL